MKKISWIIPVALLVLLACKSNSVVLSKDEMKAKAREKVLEMQELIGFNDYQAGKLMDLEYKFLYDVQKAERCFLCNKEKEVEKLKKQRELDLQKYLPRDEYIKYNAIENERIKKIPVRVSE